MKFMRLAACAVAFAVVGGMVYAEDMDIKALQAKLAAQEARLNDLQAKMGSGAAATPANIVSLRKNAKVTIGGDLDFRYIYDNYEVKTYSDADGTWEKTVKSTKGDAFVDTADLRVQVDVNEHFDAFMRLGSHDNNKATGVMRDAWIRWKNICNSGWGVLLGRDGLKFGMGKPVGQFDAWIQDNGTRSGLGNADIPHLNYGVSRVTQINPYWQSQDGKFRFDFSVFQTLESRDGAGGGVIIKDADGNTDTVNYGLGSGTIKLTMKPTEDWTFVAAVAHLYVDAEDGDKYIRRHTNGQSRDPIGGPTAASHDGPAGQGWNLSDNHSANSNTALHFGFIWTPAVFCKKLNLWAQATQEWNAGFYDNVDFFGANVGVSYAFTDKLTVFAMGDYLDSDWDAPQDAKEITGWRGWLGMNYALSNGVGLEAGWSHEQLKTKNGAGVRIQKNTGDTLYTRLTFAF